MEEKVQAHPKICILTAGIGSRLGERTTYFNKALLRVGNKAAISHTIDAFPNKAEFVIALGYKGDIVKQYLQMAHPQKKFTFIETEKYSGPGAGPGYALLKCKEQLQCPFYFVSCDSIINWQDATWGHNKTHEYVDLSTHYYDSVDWVVCDTILGRKKDYCTVLEQDGVAVNFYDKSPNGTDLAFAGVAFIHHYEKFWEVLESLKTEDKEIRDTPAIFYLKPRVMSSDWFDVGKEEGLLEARNYFEGIENLDKLDEELYVLGDTVVKYFHNSSMVQNRVERIKYLAGTTPELLSHSKNFYKYRFVEGQDLFKEKEPYHYFRHLLDYTQEKLWSQTKELEGFEKTVFKDICKKFYYDKTKSRLEKLYAKTGIKEDRMVINGDWRHEIIDELFLSRINWDWIADGIPAKFHGDYNFSNIVRGRDGFKFLDWRQDFGGSIEYGDVYYDLAKMYHSFLFPHPSVKDGKFYIEKKRNKIKTFIEIPYHIEKCKDIFEDFLLENGYNLLKTKILTGIVLLNMSPLHESPIDEYLYYYAKYYLHTVLVDRAW